MIDSIFEERISFDLYLNWLFILLKIKTAHAIKHKNYEKKKEKVQK